MSYIKVDELLTLGLTKHTHTSYEFYRDIELTILMASNYMDSVNLMEWHTALYNDDGSFFDGSYPIYARVRVTADNTVHSKWYNTGECTETIPEIIE